MSELLDFQRLKTSLPGMMVTGVTGAAIGSFMGGIVSMIAMTFFGAVVGAIVWRLGGQKFFLFIVVGIFLGSGLAIYIDSMASALLGAGTGGAVGGFVAVNARMLQPRFPKKL